MVRYTCIYNSLIPWLISPSYSRCVAHEILKEGRPSDEATCKMVPEQELYGVVPLSVEIGCGKLNFSQ